MSSREIRRTLIARIALVLATVLCAAAAAAQQSCCAGSGCCGPFGDPCILEYGAQGSVRDAVTGLPISAARIQVLDLDPVSSDADGTFRAAGSRADHCNLDYHFSIAISAPGYESYSSLLYTSVPFPTLAVELQPLDGEDTFTVSGHVAEFPACDGLMRGVTVALEPLGLTVRSTIDGGEFFFADVPPGDYVLSVVGECNPFGCWSDTPIRVTDEDYRTSICMQERTPTPTSTPMFTPTQCARPTVPLCRVGEQPRCGFDPCVAGCDCAPCDPCPEGEVYSGEQNRCDCVACPVATPCPSGQRQLPCDAPCGLGCGCEVTSSGPDEAETGTNGSGGGCAVTTSHGPSSALPLLWGLGLLALRRGARRCRVSDNPSWSDQRDYRE